MARSYALLTGTTEHEGISYKLPAGMMDVLFGYRTL